ncbi:hypothetical protein FNV43_RR12135 [Rhamnella rubrinervis]|uniref:Uncharacterized protein n=1 Tax=Rhamnella rubrinervis TaxID=2594499 RepID=A0A8K0H7Q3_9ROSA|nr:hypothetical protein FNV43_RR12135 [Rhamnella rubrinervis]
MLGALSFPIWSSHQVIVVSDLHIWALKVFRIIFPSDPLACSIKCDNSPVFDGLRLAVGGNCGMMNLGGRARENLLDAVTLLHPDLSGSEDLLQRLLQDSHDVFKRQGVKAVVRFLRGTLSFKVTGCECRGSIGDLPARLGTEEASDSDTIVFVEITLLEHEIKRKSGPGCGRKGLNAKSNLVLKDRMTSLRKALVFPTEWGAFEVFIGGEVFLIPHVSLPPLFLTTYGWECGSD